MFKTRLSLSLAAALFLAAPAYAQVNNPGVQVTGSPANNDCAKFVVSGGNVQSITTAGASCTAAVSSVFGRTGAVTAQANDYNFNQLAGNVTLAQFPSIANNTVLGNISGGSAVPTALSQAQLTALVNQATATLPGTIPAYPNNTTTFLRGDLSWAVPPGSSGANPSASVGLSAVNGVATTYMRSDAAPALSQAISPTWTGNHTFAPTSGNALTVTTATGLAQALNTTQNISGTTLVNNFGINNILINSDIADATATNGLIGLYLNYKVGGAGVKLGRIGFQATVYLNATPTTAGPYTAATFQAQADHNAGGTNTGAGAAGAVFGNNPVATLLTGATNFGENTGEEIDNLIQTGASARTRVGLRISELAASAVQGSAFDEALQLVSQVGAIGWNFGIVSDSVYAQAPLKSNGTFIASYGAQTMNAFIDACADGSHCATLTKFLNSNGFSVDGTGNETALSSITTGGNFQANAFNTGLALKNNGGTFFAAITSGGSGHYLIFNNPTGGNIFQGGDTSDPTNYYDNTTHQFTNLANNVNFVKVALAGLTVQSGHLLATGAAPSISACGTGSPSVAGGDNFGRITTGTGGLASCVINFGTTWGTAPSCSVTAQGAGILLTVVPSTTQLTISSAQSLTSGILDYICGSST
jgi:hypothetical protein